MSIVESGLEIKGKAKKGDEDKQITTDTILAVSFYKILIHLFIFKNWRYYFMCGFKFIVHSICIWWFLCQALYHAFLYSFSHFFPVPNILWVSIYMGFPGGSLVKNLPTMQETQVQSLDQEDPLEEGLATHSSILAWRIPRTEEPGRLQSTGSHRVGHDWSDWAPTSVYMHVPIYTHT